MLFPKTIGQLCCLPALFALTSLQAQSGCIDCPINLPGGLPPDTIYLGQAPDGRAGEYYSGDISFRVPQTTTPVATIDPDVPPGINISRFTINALANVPPGLDWEVSQREFDLPDETDGCIQFCGTPLQPGLYMIDVFVTARIFIFDEPATFSFPLLIEPAESVTEGFTITNDGGCGEVEALFSNNVPSLGKAGFSYFWDFGNGNVSLDENPVPQLYRGTGEYEVSYRATVDTTGYFLTRVRLESAGCEDLFNNAPDLLLRLFDPAGELVHASEMYGNTRPPLNFDMNVKLQEGQYTIYVIDIDNALDGGDDLCGMFNFNRSDAGQIEDDDAVVSLNILHPVDTILSKDTIVVYEQPEAPVLSADAESPICEGDTLQLSASYDSGLQWFVDSLPLAGADGGMIRVSSTGQYFVQYTSEEGCRVGSERLAVDFAPLPDPPVLTVDKNLIQISDSEELPGNYAVAWFLDGEPLGEVPGAAYCASESGLYSVEITEVASGCSASSDLALEYDPRFPDCTSGNEVFDRLVDAVSLSPNPTSGDFFLQIGLPEAQSVTVLIFNAQGQLLFRERRFLGSGLSAWPLTIPSHPPGLYLLQLQVDGAQRGFRVLKQ